MRMESEKKDVSVTGVLASKEFTVKFGPQLMRLLSDLYTNVVDAMVREYLTNCYDSVTALKTANPHADIPATILTVPGDLSTELVFKDFGTGMSFEKMWNVFTQYNNSTKNDDDSQVGGFGIGCKVSLAYNNGAAWIIESRYEGEKHVCVSCIGENMMPKMMHVSTETTTESSGVTIRIPILRHDYQEVRNAVTKYARYFPTPLKIEGMLPLKPLEYIFQNEKKTWGIRKTLDGEATGVRIIMGNVPYLYNKYNFPNMEYNLSKFLNNNSIDIHIPIGSVNIVPSRDDLAYTNKTKDAVWAAVQAMMVELKGEVSKTLESAETEWEALKACRAIDTVNHLSEVLAIGDTAVTWRGKPLELYKGITRTMTELAAEDGTAQASVWGVADPDFARIQMFWEGAEDKVMRVKPEDHTYVVLNDIDDMPKSERLTKAMLRDKLVHIGYNGRATKGGHSRGQAAVLTTKITPAQISEFFGGFPETDILLASALREEYKKQRAVSIAKRYKDTIYLWRTKHNEDFSNVGVGTWDAGIAVPPLFDEEGNPDEEIRFYLPLSQNGGKRYKYDARYSVALLRQWAKELGIINENTHNVLYGIKAEDVGTLDDTIWVNLRDRVEETIMAEAQSQIKDLASYVHRNESELNGDLFKLVNGIGLKKTGTPVIMAYLDAAAKVNGDAEFSQIIQTIYTAVYEHDSILDAEKKKSVASMVQAVVPLKMQDFEQALEKEYPLLSILLEFSDISSYHIDIVAEKHKKQLYKMLVNTP